MTEPNRPAKWHESVAAVLIVLLLVAACTSPCWSYVLFAWVTK